MTNGEESGQRFDLSERTAAFGENVIRFVRTVKEDSVTRPLISQLVRSSTSIGANYGEADESGTTVPNQSLQARGKRNRALVKNARNRQPGGRRTRSRVVERSTRTGPHFQQHLSKLQRRMMVIGHSFLVILRRSTWWLRNLSTSAWSATDSWAELTRTATSESTTSFRMLSTVPS